MQSKVPPIDTGDNEYAGDRVQRRFSYSQHRFDAAKRPK